MPLLLSIAPTQVTTDEVDQETDVEIVGQHYPGIDQPNGRSCGSARMPMTPHGWHSDPVADTLAGQQPAPATIGPPTRGLTVVEVDDCFHIFNPNTHRAVALNETASQIWRLCTGELNEEQIVRTLADHYGVDRTAVEPDVQRVVRDFTDEGLLEHAAAR
jgi:hypothetical protein